MLCKLNSLRSCHARLRAESFTGAFCPLGFSPSMGIFKKMAPREGLEPSTLRLTAACSTIELPRNTFVSAHIPLPTTIEIILYCVGIVKTFCNYFFVFCLIFFGLFYSRTMSVFCTILLICVPHRLFQVREQ